MTTPANAAHESHNHPASSGPDLDPKALLLETPWEELTHAYGPAGDTPTRLVQLLDPDPEIQAQALGALEMSVLHQGSLYTSTAPAMLVTAALLDHPSTLTLHESVYPWDDRARPLRASLLEWIGEFARSAAYGEPAPGDEQNQREDYNEPGVTAACRAARPALYRAVALYLTDSNPVVREAALGAAGPLLAAPELAGERPSAARRLAEVLAATGDLAPARREAAAAVLTLGAWGADTAAYLDHPDPAVRACAALAPALADSSRATQALRHALTDPRTCDQWFPEPLPQIEGWFRFTVWQTLLARTTNVDEVLPEALAMIELASDYTVENDWGPLLARAFPTSTTGRPLTSAQQQILQALADNDACWGNIGNKIRWLRDAGLPRDRDAIRDLLRSPSTDEPAT